MMLFILLNAFSVSIGTYTLIREKPIECLNILYFAMFVVLLFITLVRLILFLVLTV